MAEKAIKSYRQQFDSLSRHLDVTMPIEALSKSDLDCMAASMRESEPAANSISSYVRVFKVFLSWCNEKNITTLNMKIFISR